MVQIPVMHGDRRERQDRPEGQRQPQRDDPGKPNSGRNRRHDAPDGGEPGEAASPFHRASPSIAAEKIAETATTPGPVPVKFIQQKPNSATAAKTIPGTCEKAASRAGFSLWSLFNCPGVSVSMARVA